MTQPVPTLLSRIVDAGLPHATERLAVRLLILAEWTPSGRGQLILSWEEFSTLCHRTNRSSARRHLTALAQAGLIHYTSGGRGNGAGMLHITWPPLDAEATADPPAGAEQDAEEDASLCRGQRAHAPPEDGEATADRDGRRAQTGAHRAHPAHPHAHDGAALRHPPHTRANGGGGGIPSHPITDASTTTNHEPGIAAHLRSIGLRPAAVPVHRDLSADDVRRIIAAWQEDAASSEVGAGALLYRLRHGVTPVDATAVERSSRHKYDIPDDLRGIILG